MLNFLMKLTRVSIGCGMAIALLILLIPLLSRKFSPRWRRWAWFLIALEMILMRAPVFQAPITIPSPVLRLFQTVGSQW